MNILQQYKKAVKEREDRLGLGWAVTSFKQEVGAVFEYESGHSHAFRVGDRLTLMWPRFSPGCIYGSAKVIRRLDNSRVLMKRVS